MRVLFLLAYYYPETAASIYLFDNLIEQLILQGNEVELVVPVPSRGVDANTIKEFSRKYREEGYNGKLYIHRFKLCKEGNGTAGRFLRYFISLFKYVRVCRDIKNIDVIFCESTPPILSLAAERIKKQKKVPLVYNLQDVFPDSLVLTGISTESSFLYKLGTKIEKRAYKNADKIITISEDFKKNIIAKGVPNDKIEVVYNWVDEQAVVEIPRDKNILFDRYNLDRDKFYITYCGNIGLSQNLEMLIRTAKDLEKYKDIQFVLIGNGAYKDKLINTLKVENIHNVSLLPFQPYEEISHVFSLGDVSLVISKPGTGNGCVPSKTWSIMSASRPVLANFDDCELREIIEKGESGIFTLAGDEEGFKNAILRLYNNRDVCTLYGRNGRKYIMENLTRAIGTGKYIDVIKSIINA